MKKRILFVDDDRERLEALKSSLSDFSRGWELLFAVNGAEALVCLSQTPALAIVIELNLKTDNSAQLLDEVVRRHPKILRFILADIGNTNALMRCIGKAHQFLSKPCDAATLEDVLNQGMSYEMWLPTETVANLLTKMQKLPSPPGIYFEIVKKLNTMADLEIIGELIARDPALTAKILQGVNSTSFGLQNRITAPVEAVSFLGGETIKSLVLLSHSYSYFDAMLMGFFSINQLWEHSIATARLAQTLARAEDQGETVTSESYTGGLLHDLGKLVLAANVPQTYRKAWQLVKERKLALWEAEQEVFGATHAEVGACLLALWGLPMTLIEAVALHHHPSQLITRKFSPLTAVHCANAIEHATKAKTMPAIDMNYLADLGVQDHVESWLKSCEVDCPVPIAGP
jgi:putative nucleotidyltransferase with HDIG domain